MDFMRKEKGESKENTGKKGFRSTNLIQKGILKYSCENRRLDNNIQVFSPRHTQSKQGEKLIIVYLGLCRKAHKSVSGISGYVYIYIYIYIYSCIRPGSSVRKGHIVAWTETKKQLCDITTSVLTAFEGCPSIRHQCILPT